MIRRNFARVLPLSVSVQKLNRKALLVSTIIVGLCLACNPLFAQVNTGRILGTITDQSGGVIAGAMVTVNNTGTGVARTLTTDQAGEYIAPNLLPGTYSVRATSTGFQTFERQKIDVGSRPGYSHRRSVGAGPGHPDRGSDLGPSAVGYNQCRRQWNPRGASHCRFAPERPQL